MTISQRINNIQMLLKTADADLLAKVEMVIRSHQKGSVGSIEELPDNAKKLLAQSIEDAKEGRVRPHEDVMADVRKKYNLSGP